MSKNNYVLAEEPAADLAVLEAFAAELEEYIIKDELYRTVRVHLPAGDQMIQMSGGDLLTRIFRLSAERDKLTPEQQVRFDAARGAAEKTIYSLRTRFHQRLQREVKARLDSLNWFLDECASDPARCRGEYPFEIRNRQRIDAIVSDIAEKVLQQRPGDLRAMKNRYFSLNMQANVARNRHDDAKALEYSLQSDEAARYYTRFNPADAAGWDNRGSGIREVAFAYFDHDGSIRSITGDLGKRSWFSGAVSCASYDSEIASSCRSSS